MSQRAVIPASYQPNWSSFIGALHGVLQAFGEDADPDVLMGISGHAFRIAVSDGTEGFIAYDTPLRHNHESALPLYRNAGYELERLAAAGDDPTFDEVKSRAVKRIRQSIDRGRPVIAAGLHIADFGVIRGYDDRSRTLVVSTISQEQTGEVLPVASWPSPPDRRLDIFLLGERVAVDEAAAILDALAFACDYAERGEGRDFEAISGSRHGFQAFDAWAEALENGESINSKAHAQNAQVVLSARAHAARFLDKVADRTAVADQLRAAATAYRAEVLEWSRFCTLFPFPGAGDIEGHAAYLEGARYLRRALIHERVAIEHLREVLTVS
ncbi:MAG: hypothetical protein GEU28_03360 [Dehalococcoidia bacterium]|nr:hypothetical protein [Dehalococcoidia bacterium]